jgi:hypothetical protein
MYPSVVEEILKIQWGRAAAFSEFNPIETQGLWQQSPPSKSAAVAIR